MMDKRVEELGRIVGPFLSAAQREFVADQFEAVCKQFPFPGDEGGGG